MSGCISTIVALGKEVDMGMADLGHEFEDLRREAKETIGDIIDDELLPAEVSA